MIKKEIKFDITDEIATWKIKNLIDLFKCLDNNGYTHLYFDGYNASIDAIKVETKD